MREWGEPRRLAGVLSLVWLLGGCAQRAWVVPPPDAPTLGTAHPVEVDVVAADGGWVVLCQARTDTDGDGRISVPYYSLDEEEGDQLEPYLVFGSGPGEHIHDLIAYDDTGRYLVIVVDDRVILIDAHAKARSELLPRGQVALGSFAFSAAGEWLAYLRTGPTGQRVVVRDLRNDTERELEPGPGIVLDVRMWPSGEWLLVERLTGREPPPGHYSRRDESLGDTAGRHACDRGVRASEHLARPWKQWAYHYDRNYDSLLPPPLRRRVRVFRRASGEWRDIDDLEAPIGHSLLRHNARGELLLDNWRSPPVAVTPASCVGTVLDAYEASPRVLVGCPGRSIAREPLWIFGRDSSRFLEATVHGSSISRVRGNGRIAWYDWDDLAFAIDLHAARTFQLLPGDSIVAAYEARLLLERSGELAIVDVPSRRVERLHQPSTAYWVRRAGSMVAFRSFVVDIATGRVLGRFRGAPYAVDDRGRVLVGGDRVMWPFESSRGRTLANGPLWWQTPQ